MRIPDRFLEHRVTLEAIRTVGGSLGRKYLPPVTDVKALVVDKRQTVVDQRPNSETRGQEITVSGHVVMHKESWIPPESLVTIWPGKPMERKATVVAAGYADHRRAPESAQLWIL